jgi:NADH:ubiquinone oxidoreductase subunit E
MSQSNGRENGKAAYDVEEAISRIVNHYQAKPTALIMVLQDIQKHFHYLPIEALRSVAQKMNLPIAQIYGVATFYNAFSLVPKGEHHICVCTGTACHVRQANVIVDHLRRKLKVDPGQTTPDRKVSFETVNCLGACALGPLVTIDDDYHGNMTVSELNKLLELMSEEKEVAEMAKEVA